MPRDMPAHELPLCERYRIAGVNWANARRKFRRYDKTDDIVFDELVVAIRKCAQENGERITKTDAQTEARISDTWKNFVDRMLEAEHQMNLAEVEKKALEMEMWERNDSNATAREERRSYRTGG